MIRLAESMAEPWLLHARARRMPVLLISLCAVALAGWALANWLMSRPLSPGPVDRLPVAVLAPLMAVVLATDGFAHIDDDLESSTAVRWRLIRLTHLAVAVLLIGLAMALIGLWEPRTYGALEMTRNTAGYMGMVAASSVMMGARLAWAPTLAYGITVLATVPRPVEESAVWWTWPAQPWSVTTAVWVAAVSLACGGAAYVLWGARRSRDMGET
jgi:hypothetical protein